MMDRVVRIAQSNSWRGSTANANEALVERRTPCQGLYVCRGLRYGHDGGARAWREVHPGAEAYVDLPNLTPRALRTFLPEPLTLIARGHVWFAASGFANISKRNPIMVSAIGSATSVSASASSNTTASRVAALEKQLATYQKDLSTAQKAEASADNMRTIQKLQQQIAALEAQIAQLKQAAAQASSGAPGTSSGKQEAVEKLEGEKPTAASDTLGNRVDELA